ncbi:MAG: enolase C-terminal domain-like protein [Candidatus Sericytochromatia bacterium]|nr:enolase C-terminal domain-like protein [Candidatus Sericytochromatia bacterium]
MRLSLLSVESLEGSGVPTAHGNKGRPWRVRLRVTDGQATVWSEAVALPAFGVGRGEAMAHALGWAALDLEAKAGGLTLPETLARCLGRNALAELETTALLAGPTSGLAAAAKAAWQNGYQTFKLKLGKAGDALRPLPVVVAEALERVETVLRALPEQATLRLDANRAWTLEQAEAFTRPLANLAGERLAWLEDPCMPGTPWSALLEATAVPLAPDESCAEPDALTPWLGHPRVAAVVVKPVLWGPERTLELARLAIAHGKPIVASSAYEEQAGLAVVSAVAAAAGTVGCPHGLLLGTTGLPPRTGVLPGLPRAS